MNPSTPAAPRRLDTRAESPMGDDDLPVPNGSPVHRNTPHGLPTPSNDAPSSGFTAVNGDSHRTLSFRPGDTAQPLVTMPSSDTRSSTGPDPASASSTYNPHNWRPDERHAQPDSTRPRHDTHSATKRKRADSANIEHRSDVGDDQADSASNSPPKRRATAFDSPERTRQPRSYSVDRHELPPPATGPYVREPSPVYRTPRAEPLPPPRPEAEAALAASLQQTLDAEQQAQVAVPESESPSNDIYEQEESQHYGAEQHGDSSDPKPRKRNFSNRTKTGCHTCRARKKKCDEGKPTCENCKRGSFECGGYGPKPPGGMKISAARNVMPIQSKQPYEQHPHGHPPFYEPSHYHNGDRRVPPPWDYSRPDAYAASHPPPQQHRYPPQPGPMDPHNRPSSGRDSWARPPWGAHEQPPSTYLSEHLPPVDYSNVPPVHTYPPERLMHPDSWGPPPPTSHYRRSIPLPPQSTSSRGSGLSIRSMPNSIIAPAGQKTEKNKMMSGQPYKHYTDDELVRDRTSCKRAVEAYNNACTPSSTLLPLEKERHFTSILDPRARNFSDILGQHWPGPVGTCGARTIVEAPFTCELGYNIHLGNEVLVAANCHMQDACPIMIGDRTVVGHNVKFYCVTASVDPTLRTGSKGNFYAGPIRIEEDVYIGADAIILPYRTVGKGATVGAGAVVTRDVKPYTVVGGNPAKPIRKHRIEPGRNVDRHDDAIEDENQKMLDWLKNGFAADLQRKLQNDRKL